MGHLQCISNASKMIKPLNLGCPYSLLIMIVWRNYYYSQLHITCVNSFQDLFETRV
jgi:hypothetical protein